MATSPSSSRDVRNMALFCDFENVVLGVRDTRRGDFDIRLVLERLLIKGDIVVKKAYCDWDRYKDFKRNMHEAAFEMIEIPHVRQSGKNSADIRMVVDALDLCYTKTHVDAFVIISGDSDFSPLVSKLRENNRTVIGVGVRSSTSDLLVDNCDEFIFYDDLVKAVEAKAKKVPAKKPAAKKPAKPAAEATPEVADEESRRAEAIELVVETLEALLAEKGVDDVHASQIKSALMRRHRGFVESRYGYKAFGKILEDAEKRGLLSIHKQGQVVAVSLPRG